MDGGEETDKTDKENDGQGVCCTKVCNPTSAIHRYIILIFLCLCGIGDYFCLDSPAALESNILHDLHLSEAEYMGFYSWVYWPGAVTCLLSGYFIDKVLGVRLGIGLFSWLVAVGQGLFATGAFVNKYWMMCVGRILFALAGSPFALSTQKLTAKWFRGRELNMAFGLRVSVARVGSVVNLNVMQPIYIWFSDFFRGYQCLGMALYVGVAICALSFLAGLLICYLDKRADNRLKHEKDDKENPLRLSEIKEFPLTFWLTAFITTVYYLALFPFISLGPLPYMVSLAMPVFGLIIDKTGRNLIWLFLGIILSLGAHTLLTFTFVDPYAPVIILGIGYTIITAVVWPLVAYVVKERHLGTAYGIMNAMISIAQGGISILTGYLADARGYLILQVFFMACVCGSLLLSVWLYLSDSLRGGLLMISGTERAKQNQKEIDVPASQEEGNKGPMLSESQK